MVVMAILEVEIIVPGTAIHLQVKENRYSNWRFVYLFKNKGGFKGARGGGGSGGRGMSRGGSGGGGSQRFNRPCKLSMN